MCIRDRDDMSNEAVEYVRGIPVVKTFGQTIFSFKKFKDSIDRYKVCLLYTSFFSRCGIYMEVLYWLLQ